MRTSKRYATHKLTKTEVVATGILSFLPLVGSPLFCVVGGAFEPPSTPVPEKSTPPQTASMGSYSVPSPPSAPPPLRRGL